MTSLREAAKRVAPHFAIKAINDLRGRLAPPPLEAIKLHPYRLRRDSSLERRLTLVLPSLSKEKVFGGVATGIEIFLSCAAKLSARPRIAIDDFDRRVDQAFLAREARRAGFAIEDISLLYRDAEEQQIDVRANEVFFAFNWWTSLNLLPLVVAQEEQFNLAPRPIIYLIQEYEPLFYAMSSTHMYARKAFGNAHNWAIVNSGQLHAYLKTQGHAFAREFVFEPRLPARLRPFLDGKLSAKEKVILTYGRPAIARNCFSAILDGLRGWASSYPEFKSWSVLSAGAPHAPIPLGDGRSLTSLGKLSLEDYGSRLRDVGVGLSLMASPHPSYPPLEMAHFGALTVTNSYLCKDLSSAHDNIVSLPNIDAQAIAQALAEACRRVEVDPHVGWRGCSHVPSYLEAGPLPMYKQLIPDLEDLMAS